MTKKQMIDALKAGFLNDVSNFLYRTCVILDDKKTETQRATEFLKHGFLITVEMELGEVFNISTKPIKKQPNYKRFLNLKCK